MLDPRDLLIVEDSPVIILETHNLKVQSESDSGSRCRESLIELAEGSLVIGQLIPKHSRRDWDYLEPALLIKTRPSRQSSIRVTA